ncbi:MAG: tyrosine-type recombinase/integrase [Terriglobales bacterium]
MARIRRFQRGLVFKRGTRKKVWVGRWWEDVIGLNGQVERVRRSEILAIVAECPTKRDAERLLAERLYAVNSGDCRPQASCTFRDFVQDKWLPEVLPTLKYSTQQHYQYITKLHLIPAFGDLPLRFISRDAAQHFLAAKLQSGLSWKTVKHLRTVFGTILTAAEGWDLIQANPVRKTRMPRRPRCEKPTIALESVTQLLKTLAEPSRSLAWLLVLTGLRVGELLALRWQDVDLDAGFLRVRQTVYEGHFDEPKSRSSARTVPLASRAIEIFSSRKPASVDPARLIFATGSNRPLSRRNRLNRQLRPAAEALALAGINWHWLRHANATLHDSVGTPLGTVQALLGHSSPEITRSIYIHSVPADAKNAVEKVQSLLIGPKWTQIVEIPKPVTSLIQ